MPVRILLNLFIIAALLANIACAQRAPYYFTIQIDSLLQADSTPYRYQFAAWNFSFIGDHKNALAYKDKQFPNAKPLKPSEEQIALFGKFRPAAAANTILKEAEQTRILIINEAHHMASHRVFTASLLPRLKQLGYNYFAVEALGYDDSLLNTRGYPVMQTGFYTSEPSFGNLIREAIANGLHVFAYEQNHKDSLQLRMGREQAQARNIKRIWDSDPDAKLVIYCGYDHAAEDSLSNFMGLPMAGWLKRLTAVDPFTIDQTALTEAFSTGRRYRKLIDLDYPAIFMDSNGNYFNQANLPKMMDCNIYHPDTRYAGGRPDWLFAAHTEPVYLQDRITISYPCLAKIYMSTDDTAHAVPMDVVELPDATARVASVSVKGKKQIAVITSLRGERQTFSIR